MDASTDPTDVNFAPWDDPGEDPYITFRGVTKRFGQTTAIDDVDLDIYRGEFFALLGPSGCGKTTMMRMIAGFESPTAGTIRLDGQDIAGMPPNQRPVNMMFQSYALFPHLSVRDNIAFGLKRSDRSKDEIQDRVTEMLRLTRLDRLGDRKPHNISGGQRQRVALARALARAPKLLLLDEPLGALDAKLRQETQFELVDIQEKTGTTFVVVTHDQEEAMTVATRIAVMNEGRIAQVATPPVLYEGPANRYVADFIGDVTILSGTARRDAEDRLTIDWADGQPPIHACRDPLPASGSEVHFAIRPEKIAISKERPETADNAIKGEVMDIAYLGNLSTYHVRLADGTILKAQITNHRRLSRREITWRDTVWMSFTETAGAVLLE